MIACRWSRRPWSPHERQRRSAIPGQRYDCAGLDLVKDRRSKTPDPDLAQRVARTCLELGMMTSVVRGGFGIFRIAPPLTVEESEIDLGLEIFDTALAKALH
jgi:4-aminobutyrate aminotransferase-like enzyme